MYVLHSMPDTASTIIRLMMQELGIACEYRLIDQAGGALDSPAYRAMHPMGVIPAMETPDGPMFETGAMLLYLADRHPGLAPAPDDIARADWLSWFVFTNQSVHTTVMQIFYPERVAGDDCIPAVLAAAKVRMQSHLAHLEKKAATLPVWLSPDTPSMLGYYIGVLTRWLAQSPIGAASHVSTRDYPALRAVLAAMEARPAALAVAQVEGLGPTIFTNPKL